MCLPHVPHRRCFTLRPTREAPTGCGTGPSESTTVDTTGRRDASQQHPTSPHCSEIAQTSDFRNKSLLLLCRSNPPLRPGPPMS
eukprot:1978614-Pleurochrysis_carterae.AAC.1